VLSDDEADRIRRGVQEEGMRGPILLKWIRQLLDDRDERLGRRPPARAIPASLRRPRRRR